MVQLLGLIGFTKGQFPMRYLGVPLVAGKLSYHDYGPIMDKIKGRLAGWKTKPLSYAWRLVLIRAVLQGCYIY